MRAPLSIKATVCITIPSALLADLDAAAVVEERTRSATAVRAIREYLERQPKTAESRTAESRHDAAPRRR